MNATIKLISTLLVQKHELENLCESKNWDWEKCLKEHLALETIDAKLLELGYYDAKQKWTKHFNLCP